VEAQATNGRWEDITNVAALWGVGEAHMVAKKWGNAHGAKGPY
jgi:hypothetical protein